MKATKEHNNKVSLHRYNREIKRQEVWNMFAIGKTFEQVMKETGYTYSCVYNYFSKFTSNRIMKIRDGRDRRSLAEIDIIKAKEMENEIFRLIGNEQVGLLSPEQKNHLTFKIEQFSLFCPRQ